MLRGMSKTKTIDAHLADLGAPSGCRSWTLQCVRGAHMLKPRNGQGIGLYAVLPPGAVVTNDDESGVVEYSPTGSGYVRLSPHVNFDTPQGLLVNLIDCGATIITDES